MKNRGYEQIGELANRVNYDKQTGVITWKKTQNNRALANSVAGRLSDGYIRIGFKYKEYHASHLAWFITTGEILPEGTMIDHLDGYRSNNKIQNLRVSCLFKNNNNRQEHRNGKIPGIVQNKSGTWSARVQFQKKTTYLGTYATPDEAILKRKAFISRVVKVNPEEIYAV